MCALLYVSVRVCVCEGALLCVELEEEVGENEASVLFCFLAMAASK